MWDNRSWTRAMCSVCMCINKVIKHWLFIFFFSSKAGLNQLRGHLIVCNDACFCMPGLFFALLMTILNRENQRKEDSICTKRRLRRKDKRSRKNSKFYPLKRAKGFNGPIDLSKSTWNTLTKMVYWVISLRQEHGGHSEKNLGAQESSVLSEAEPGPRLQMGSMQTDQHRCQER